MRLDMCADQVARHQKVIVQQKNQLSAGCGDASIACGRLSSIGLRKEPKSTARVIGA